MTSVIVGGGFVFICYWHLHTPAYQHFTHTCTVEEVKSTKSTIYKSTSKVQSTHARSNKHPRTHARIDPYTAHLKPLRDPANTHQGTDPHTRPYKPLQWHNHSTEGDSTKQGKPSPQTSPFIAHTSPKRTPSQQPQPQPRDGHPHSIHHHQPAKRMQ